MIYFILCPVNRWVKIGRSKDPQKRLHGLRAMSPVDLEMIGTIDGDGEMERKLHTHFFNAHARDEWFHYDRICHDIDQLISGAFNLGDLPDNGKKSWALARGDGWRKVMEAKKRAAWAENAA